MKDFNFIKSNIKKLKTLRDELKVYLEGFLLFKLVFRLRRTLWRKSSEITTNRRGKLRSSRIN